MNFKVNHKFLSLLRLAIIVVACLPHTAFGWLTLGVSGMESTSSYSYSVSKKTAVSANIGIALGQHFQLGLSHAVQTEEVNSIHPKFKYAIVENRKSKTSSFDFTIIPVVALVSPFAFAGLSLKSIEMSRTEYGPVPFQIVWKTREPKSTMTYGYGLKFYVSKNFDLKITRRFTPAVKIERDSAAGTETLKDTFDVSTQIGLSIKI